MNSISARHEDQSVGQDRPDLVTRFLQRLGAQDPDGIAELCRSAPRRCRWRSGVLEMVNPGFGLQAGVRESRSASS